MPNKKFSNKIFEDRFKRSTGTQQLFVNLPTHVHC